MRKDKRGSPPSTAPSHLLPLQLHSCYKTVKILQRKMLWRAGAVGRVCSVKKMFLKFSQFTQKNTCAEVFFLTKLQIFNLQLYQKRDSHTDVFQCILQNFKSHFFKYTFGWLLRIEGWISLKMAPIAIAINISNASYQGSSYFSLTWCLFMAKSWKFLKVYFCLLNSNGCKGTVFSSKLLFFFFQ